MDSINGVSLEKYADLCALMANTAGDASKENEIAEQNGVSAADWAAAKAGFLAKMSDPADMGKTALAFMPLYQAAQAKMRGGTEPCSLETYAIIHTQMAYRKDANGNQIDYNIVLGEHGFTHQSWLECEGYWTPRVASETDPNFKMELHQKFAALVQAESDKMNGIVR
jgi:hypothetical protein